MDSSLKGNTGECYVPAELSRRGCTAAHTARDARAISVVPARQQDRPARRWSSMRPRWRSSPNCRESARFAHCRRERRRCGGKAARRSQATMCGGAQARHPSKLGSSSRTIERVLAYRRASPVLPFAFCYFLCVPDPINGPLADELVRHSH